MKKNVRKVDLGIGFLNDKSGQELILFLSSFLLRKNVVDPLNDGTRLYFCLLYDGASSAKTSDEKELYIINTCNNGRSQFHVLSVQEPDDTGSQGLHEALEKATDCSNFKFNRSERQVGIGSDGASTNLALCALLKEAVRDHLVFMWCLSHKLELALKDAFKDKELDKKAQEQLLLNFTFLKKQL